MTIIIVFVHVWVSSLSDNFYHSQRSFRPFLFDFKLQRNANLALRANGPSECIVLVRKD